MKTALLTLSFCALFFSASWSQDFSRVKVFADEYQLFKLSELGVTVDHGIHKEGVFFISDFSKAEIDIMRQHDYQFEVLIADVEAFYIDQLTNGGNAQTLKNVACPEGGNSAFNPATPSNFNLGTMGGYLKYNEMLAELDDMLAQYPNLITAKAPISNFLTHGGRPIYQVKISDNPNQEEANEPKALYTAIHHAREPMSLMSTIFFMWYLLENYGVNEEVTYLVDNTQLYFVPCLNPDGYLHNESTNPNGGGMWRKNRRNNGSSFGVDLNRNYSYQWGTTGTSTNPSNDTYCGTAPFSEPETQAMRWMVQNHNFVMAFNAHTFSPSILFPIGTTTAEFADHHSYFQEYTNHMVEWNGYPAMKSSGLYPASGDSDDYMYKMDVGVGQKDTVFAHTPEIGTAFWQPQSEIVPTCAEMVFPNLVLAHLTRNYHLTKDADPSYIGPLTGNFNHTITRLGRMSGNVTVSIEPLLNIQSVGNPVTYNLNLQQTQNGAISYVLNPSIQFGDFIRYVLKTDNGLWVKRDTITKNFGAIALQVTEDASATANWTGNWNTTTATFVSAPRSFTDSPSGNYANNANTNYTYTPSVDLTNAVAAKVSFFAKWDIEADYDFVQFQVSTNNGATWVPQCGKYTVPGQSGNGSVQPNGQPVYEGVQSSWVQEEISLSEYLGQTIRFRFQLRSDGGTRKDGFYFDDFKIFYNLQAPPQAPVAAFQVNNTTVCVGSTVQFTDYSTNIPTSWSWNFGDGGGISTQPNPTHVFTTTGTYTVSLTVTNAEGSDTYSLPITVVANPTVSINSNDADNLFCNTAGVVTLTLNPSTATVIGPGVSGTNFNPATAGVGVHTLTASFTNEFGCTASEQLILTVENCASISSLSESKLSLIPNPNTGVFTLRNADLGANISIVGLDGKSIFEGKINGSIQSIDISFASQGIYILETTEEGILHRIKFMVK
jgi:carboxypeptidase T